MNDWTFIFFDCEWNLQMVPLENAANIKPKTYFTALSDRLLSHRPTHAKLNATAEFHVKLFLFNRLRKGNAINMKRRASRSYRLLSVGYIVFLPYRAYYKEKA